MPRGVQKQHLPEKTCVVCHRPFTWRKKWERVWDEVQTCSKSCQRTRRRGIRLEQYYDKRQRQQATAQDGSFVANEASSSGSSSVKDDMMMTATELVDVKREDDPRYARKAAKKRAKELQRAKRQGTIQTGQKPCTVCNEQVDLLIRCQIDESKGWNMVCGSCWNHVSGGMVDGDAEHPYYRYGGLWKNRSKRR